MIREISEKLFKAGASTGLFSRTNGSKLLLTIGKFIIIPLVVIGVFIGGFIFSVILGRKD